MADQEKALAAIKKYIKVTGEDAPAGLSKLSRHVSHDGMPPLDGIDLVQEMAIQSGR